MPKPYVAQPTRQRFYVPKTLEADFDEFLDNDIPGAVGSFVLLKDWYDQFEDDYTEQTVRCEVYPDSSKSRYTNTDNYLNLRSSVSSNIQKGDMVISPQGTIFLLDWRVPPESNNRMSRALYCNALMTFQRWHEAEADALGYRIADAGWTDIAKEIPCNVYRYDGRPDYSVASGQPGLVPNALTEVSLQYNSHTKNILADDEVNFGIDRYVVIDVNYAGLNLKGDQGVINLQLRKKAGGLNNV